MEKEKILSVSDANRIAKNIMEVNSPDSLSVLGEISNITYHTSGHLYFTIKDSKSYLKCLVFSYKNKGIESTLKHGDSVKISGRLTIYEATGQYQIVGIFVEKEDNKGNLYKKFLALKEKLQKKGYFDESLKKKIPLTFNLGVVTSLKGAVIRDIVTTAQSRFENINIFLVPAKVQGDGADKEIIEGIKLLNSIEYIDTIIIGRGGGSFEDLNAFNSEALAEAIHKSIKPIISAVGHETDYMISDMVADARAFTPTHAAALAVPSKKDMIININDRREKLNRNLKLKVKSLEIALQNKTNSYILKNFVDDLSNRRVHIDQIRDKIQNIVKNNISKEKETFGHKLEMLKNLNPINILSRGYSLIEKNNKVINSSKEIKKGDKIDNIFFDGKVSSIVI